MKVTTETYEYDIEGRIAKHVVTERDGVPDAPRTAERPVVDKALIDDIIHQIRKINRQAGRGIL